MGLSSFRHRRPGVPWHGLGLLACAAVALALPACEWDGNFTLLGYTTAPNYRADIHSVRVPLFKNKTFWRGLEFDLTQAVVDEIEKTTRMKVVSDGPADTELIGTITLYTKATLNVSPVNEVREAETTLVVEVLWKDLRTGEILSRPSRRPGEPLPIDAIPLPTLPPGSPTIPATPTGPNAPLPPGTSAPDAAPAGAGSGLLPPPPPGPPPGAGPVVIRSVAGFIPELGQSLTTAQQKNVQRLAVQIVSMMEKPW